MSASFRWGIIGPGRIAKKFADCVHSMPDTQIEAIASRSRRDLDTLKKEMHARQAFSFYEEMLSASQLDAVYIATPHRYHFENTVICLEYGIPALVEKAFTINSAEAQKLVDTAREKRIFLIEALWTRFLPVYKQAREWMDDGLIGKVTLAQSTLGFKAARDLDDRLLNIELAGGSVLDLGVYSAAASQFAFRQEPVDLCAQGFIGETGVDEAVSVCLDYSQGRFSQFSFTFLALPPNKLEIVGERGAITFDPIFVSTHKATLESDGIIKVFDQPHEINGFEYQIREAQRCIQTGLIESPLMTH